MEVEFDHKVDEMVEEKIKHKLEKQQMELNGMMKNMKKM